VKAYYLGGDNGHLSRKTWLVRHRKSGLYMTASGQWQRGRGSDCLFRSRDAALAALGLTVTSPLTRGDDYEIKLLAAVPPDCP